MERTILRRHPRKSLLLFLQPRAKSYSPRKLEAPISHEDSQFPDPQKIGYGGERGSIHSVSRPLALFHLGYDPGEQIDRSKDFPRIVSQIEKFIPQGVKIANTPSPQWLRVLRERTAN